MKFNLSKKKEIGFLPPKGHLDTQMYPECEGTKYDRDVVKKTREKRKKKKKKASIDKFVIKTAIEFPNSSDMGAAVIKFEQDGRVDASIISCSLKLDDKNGILAHFKSVRPNAKVLSIDIMHDNQRPTEDELNALISSACSTCGCGIVQKSEKEFERCVQDIKSKNRKNKKASVENWFKIAEFEEQTDWKSTLQECPCGSGEFPTAAEDARGIFLCYVCPKCKKEKLSKYRKDVLTNPNYWADEPIEPEDYY